MICYWVITKLLEKTGRFFINESLGNDYFINICELTDWPLSS